MLYCDLAIDNITIWTGVPCKNGTGLKSSGYLAFSGTLMPIDSLETSDPTYELLGTRFQILFISDLVPATNPSYVQILPLQAIPSQQIEVTLDRQNCSLSFYDKPTV
jgi:hypothetical protein